jgi:hypothetical protein
MNTNYEGKYNKDEMTDVKNMDTMVYIELQLYAFLG